ncbi:hypothetical protein GCM10010836_09790 [Aminobacter aminovorans]
MLEDSRLAKVIQTQTFVDFMSKIPGTRAASPSGMVRMGMIALAGATIVSLIAYDFADNDRDLLAKDRVEWTLFGLIRPIVALISACLVAVSSWPMCGCCAGSTRRARWQPRKIACQFVGRQTGCVAVNGVRSTGHASKSKRTLAAAMRPATP